MTNKEIALKMIELIKVKQNEMKKTMPYTGIFFIVFGSFLTWSQMSSCMDSIKAIFCIMLIGLLLLVLLYKTNDFMTKVVIKGFIKLYNFINKDSEDKIEISEIYINNL